MEDELAEVLDNVTASLETCMAWFGSQMPEADQIGRNQNIQEARALLSKFRKSRRQRARKRRA